MESDTLIGNERTKPETKVGYHAVPAAAPAGPGPGPTFTTKTVFGDVRSLSSAAVNCVRVAIRTF